MFFTCFCGISGLGVGPEHNVKLAVAWANSCMCANMVTIWAVHTMLLELNNSYNIEQHTEYIMFLQHTQHGHLTAVLEMHVLP